MFFTKEEWGSLLDNTPYFQNGSGFGSGRNPHITFWRSNLDAHGSINILTILGLRTLPARFNGDVGATLRDQTCRNIVLTSLNEHQTAEQNVQDALDKEKRENGQCDEQLLKEIKARVRLYQMWLRVLNDAAALEDYIQAMDIDTLWEDVMDRSVGQQPVFHAVGAQQRTLSVSNAIRTQRRRLPHDFTSSHPHDLVCEHCGLEGHATRKCPKGGYMIRDKQTGNPKPSTEESAPKCFCCGRRHPTIVINVGTNKHVVFHCSTNCPYRHPNSFGFVGRNCRGCGNRMQYCWNCARPSCMRQMQTRTRFCEGHRLNRCPEIRYRPQLDQEVYGPAQRLLPHEQLRAMNIGSTPREVRGKLGPAVAQTFRRSNMFAYFDAMRRYRLGVARLLQASTPQQRMSAEQEILAGKEMMKQELHKIVTGEEPSVGVPLVEEAQQQQANEDVFSEDTEQSEEITVDVPIPTFDPPQCIICQEHTDGATFIVLPCCTRTESLKYVHIDCLMRWANSMDDDYIAAKPGMVPCPFCREDLHLGSLDYILPQPDIGEDEVMAIRISLREAAANQQRQGHSRCPRSQTSQHARQTFDPTLPSTSAQAQAETRCRGNPKVQPEQVPDEEFPKLGKK